LQPDFQQQKSLVQEVIEAAGHLCILLPKFHCELNFIEFFWGAVKKYLRDNCDYTFDTLKENMPKALASVELQTIWRWEHQMFRWMGAYRGDDRCSETGEGIQFHKIQVTQACSGSRRSYFRPVIIAFCPSPAVNPENIISLPILMILVFRQYNLFRRHKRVFLQEG